MSVFSEYLTIIKNKRNLNSAEVANICGIDTTVIFRWLKGERIPEDINKLRRLELKLRLSENEKDELEDAYIITVHGRQNTKILKISSEFCWSLEDTEMKVSFAKRIKHYRSFHLFQKVTQICAATASRQKNLKILRERVTSSMELRSV